MPNEHPTPWRAEASHNYPSYYQIKDAEGGRLADTLMMHIATHIVDAVNGAEEEPEPIRPVEDGQQAQQRDRRSLNRLKRIEAAAKVLDSLTITDIHYQQRIALGEALKPLEAESARTAEAKPETAEGE